MHAFGVVSAWERLLSLLLDLVIGAVVLTLLSMAALLAVPLPELPPITAVLLPATLYLFYHVIFLSGFGGLPGQLMLGQRVIDREDRGHLTPPAAILRAVAGAASLACLGLGFLPMFFNARVQAMHDMLANSVVVSLRARVEP